MTTKTETNLYTVRVTMWTKDLDSWSWREAFFGPFKFEELEDFYKNMHQQFANERYKWDTWCLVPGSYLTH